MGREFVEQIFAAVVSKLRASPPRQLWNQQASGNVGFKIR